MLPCYIIQNSIKTVFLLMINQSLGLFGVGIWKACVSHYDLTDSQYLSFSDKNGGECCELFGMLYNEIDIRKICCGQETDISM